MAFTTTFEAYATCASWTAMNEWREGDGDISITSTGSTVATTGAIHATGAGGGFGGTITIESSTSTVSIGAAVTANGSSGAAGHNDGGDITLTSGGDMSLSANITANGNGSFAFGGDIAIASGGNVIAANKIHALGDTDGDGGSIDVEAVDETEFDDTVRTNGGASGGTGGAITITGASVLIKGDWNTTGGAGADGGTVEINAENGDFELEGMGFISAVAGNGGDGDTIDITATGNVALNGELFASASGGGTGGDITVTGDGNVSIGANISVNGAGTDSSGGTITVTGGTNHTVTISQIVERGIPRRRDRRVGLQRHDHQHRQCALAQHQRQRRDQHARVPRSPHHQRLRPGRQSLSGVVRGAGQRQRVLLPLRRRQSGRRHLRYARSLRLEPDDDRQHDHTGRAHLSDHSSSLRLIVR